MMQNDIEVDHKAKGALEIVLAPSLKICLINCIYTYTQQLILAQSDSHGNSTM